MNYKIARLINKSKEKQKGATAVEFAIVVSVFILIVFGIIEFGLLMYNQHIVTNAGREGARAGIVSRPFEHRLDEGQIKSIVGSYAENNIVTFGEKEFEVEIEIIDESPERPAGDHKKCAVYGETLSVSVHYRYEFLFLPFTRDMTSTTRMKCE